MLPRESWKPCPGAVDAYDALKSGLGDVLLLWCGRPYAPWVFNKVFPNTPGFNAPMIEGSMLDWDY